MANPIKLYFFTYDENENFHGKPFEGFLLIAKTFASNAVDLKKFHIMFLMHRI
jgi:hypothetical protein